MGRRGNLTEKAETRVSKTTRKRLEQAAKRADRSTSAVLRRALERYLDEVDLGGRSDEIIGEGLPAGDLP